MDCAGVAETVGTTAGVMVPNVSADAAITAASGLLSMNDDMFTACHRVVSVHIRVNPDVSLILYRLWAVWLKEIAVMLYSLP